MKRLRSKQKTFNVPYCFDDDLLTKDNKLVVGDYTAWVDIRENDYLIHVQNSSDHYIRKTNKIDLHLAYWIAYDLIQKSVHSGFRETMKMSEYWHKETIRIKHVETTETITN